MTTPNEYQDLADHCAAIIGKFGRISKPMSRFFFIAETPCHTKEDEAVILNGNGEQQHFGYKRGEVVASGYTEEELLQSCRDYVALSKMTWEEILKLRPEEFCRYFSAKPKT